MFKRFYLSIFSVIGIVISVICVSLISISTVHASTIGMPPVFVPGVGLNSGLVGWWTFDGKDTNWNSNTTSDKSGNSNTGTLTNMSTTTAPVPGKVGQGLKFDGVDDYVRIVSSSSLNIGGSWTVGSWVNLSALPSSSKWQAVVAKGGSGDGTGHDHNYIITLDNGIWGTGQSVIAQFEDSAGTNYQAIWNNSLTLNRWYYLMGVYNTTDHTVTLYINGSRAAQTTSVTATPYTNPDDVTIARTISDTPAANQEYVNGSIDDVRIYNRALSATEIQRLYNQGVGTHQASSPPVTATSSCSTGLSCGLVGYWTLDGKDTNWNSNTTSDKSGNGNTGTLTNMSTTTAPVPGKVGQGLKFDGVDDYTIIPDSSSLDTIEGSNSATIAFWAKRMVSGTVYYLERWSTGGRQFIMYDGGFNIRPQWRYGGSNTGGSSLDHICAVATCPVPVGTWTHVVVVYNNPTSYIYVDGVFKSSQSGSGGALNSAITGGVAIGATNTGTSPSNVIMDDVRIYNRALSATEIQQLYDVGAGSHRSSSGQVTATSSCTSGLSCGLVGYWTFDGKDTNWNSNTTSDKSGNGNTGTLTNMSTTTAPVPGKVGQALKFDGSSQFISAGSPSSLTDLPALTVSTWVNTPSVTTGKGLVTKMDNSIGGHGWGLCLDTTSGRIKFSVAGFGGTDLAVTSVNGAITAGVWTHLVATWDGGSLTSGVHIYSNGSELGKQSTTDGGTGPQSDSGVTVQIGANTGGGCPNSGYFTGSEDDVRIYNRALSATEIRQLYNIGR